MALEARKSSIEGTGCYTTAPIKKGDVAGEYTGPIISHPDADEEYSAAEATYLFIIDDERVIDATHDPNPVKYINHSCDPNCESDQRGERIYIVAIRDIEPGQELSYDYCLDVDEDEDDPCTCNCGTAKCRGTMIAPDDDDDDHDHDIFQEDVVREFIRGSCNGEIAALEEVMAKDIHYISSDQEFFSREDYLDSLRSENGKPRKYEILKIVEDGEDDELAVLYRIQKDSGWQTVAQFFTIDGVEISKTHLVFESNESS